jgi:gliding motility-associated-like protein
VKKAAALFIFCVGFSLPIFSQNLVPNPSFEKINHVPCSWVRLIDFRRIYDSWFQPTGGTTDVFTTFADSSCYASCFSTHEDASGFQAPHSGNVMTAILTSGKGCDGDNYREYLGIKLTESLLPLKTYYAEMYVSRGDTSKNATNNIGMYFSEDSIASPYYCQNLGYKPHINTDTIITNNEGWEKVSGYFSVNDSVQFLYIGNMYTNEETIIQTVSNTGEENTRYFIDDVLVRPCLSVTPDTLICRGDSVTLRAWGSHVYGWADAEKPEIILSEDSVITERPNITTTYFVYSICDTLSVTVSVPEQLKDTALCRDDSLHIPLKYADASNFDAGDSSIWLSEPSEYIISRAFPYCIQTDTFTLSHRPLPILDLGSDSLICKIDTVMLDVSEEHTRFKWEDGSEYPIRTITQPGAYTIEGWLNSCYNKNSINITLEECATELLMPNVITPNDDHMNDRFIPIDIKGIIEMKLSIFNRYGVEVFNSTNFDHSWDGTFNGDPVPPGAYYYQLNYRDKNDITSTAKGIISVIR